MAKEYLTSPIYQKELQKYPTLNPTQILKLSIVELLNQGKLASDVARDLNMKENALSYHLSSLKKQGIIQYVSYGTWEVLQKINPEELQKSTSPTTSKRRGVEVLEIVEKQPKKETRGHGFTIKFKIRDRITNWHRRYDVIKQNQRLRQELHPRSLQGGKGVGIKFKDHKIHLWNKSIVIFSDISFISKKATESKSTAVAHFISLIKGLERIFGCEDQFKFRGNYCFSFSREHYALMRNVMARQYNSRGEKLHVVNQYGVWCLIDDSLNLDELEFVKNRNPDPQDTVKNTEGMQQFLNEMKELEWEFQPKAVMQMVGTTAQNVDYYGKHMVSHVALMQRITERLDKMDVRDERTTQALEKIAKMLEDLNGNINGGKKP